MTSKLARFARGAFIAALAVPALAALAAAVNTKIDPAKSTVIATFKQEGVPVDVPFKRFSGVIAYDPANLAASSASLDVETASLDFGDALYDEESRKKQWFDSATYPKATFRSTAIKAGATADQLSATGTLTIKGKAQSITVPIKMQKLANATAFDGALTISRKTFAIGDPAWEDVLEDKVNVRFHFVVANQ
jgi:polyisoprenoid-binding protein YceI